MFSDVEVSFTSEDCGDYLASMVNPLKEILNFVFAFFRIYAIVYLFRL